MKKYIFPTLVFLLTISLLISCTNTKESKKEPSKKELSKKKPSKKKPSKKNIERSIEDKNIEAEDAGELVVNKNYEVTKNPKADKDLLDPKQDVIVVFKDNIKETEDLILENGLKLEKVVFDQNSLKVGLIRIPSDKKDFWLDKLIKSGKFKDVKLYSEKALKKLTKEQNKK